MDFGLTQIIYEKLFTSEECDRIIKLFDELPEPEMEGQVLIHGIDYQIRKTKVKGLNVNHDIAWLVNPLKNMIVRLNHKYYQQNLFKIEPLQLLKYKENGHFGWHTDAATDSTLAMRKLSIIIFLSDCNDYQGGQLEIEPDTGNKIPMEKGFMLMFPSYKMHRVTTVTSGERYTLVTWAHGH